MDLPSNHGFCLTLVIFTRPDPVPDLWIDFPALHWTCLVTMNLSGGVTSWLKLAVVSKPVLLPLLGCWLVRSWFRGCAIALAPLFLREPDYSALQHFLPFLKATCILSGTDHKCVAVLSPLDSSFFTAHLFILSTVSIF